MDIVRCKEAFTTDAPGYPYVVGHGQLFAADDCLVEQYPQYFEPVSVTNGCHLLLGHTEHSPEAREAAEAAANRKGGRR